MCLGVMFHAPMRRPRWVWWLFWVFVVSLATNARAGDFAEIRVCVRPPNVPPGVEAWVYTPGSATVVVKVKREDFKKQSGGLTTYVFDPNAPVENTQLLPIPYNKLACAARVLPVKPIAPPLPDPKRAAPPKAGEPAPSGGGTADKEENKGDNDEPPPGTPPPIVYPNGKPRAPPQLDLSTAQPDKHLTLPVLDREGRGRACCRCSRRAAGESSRSSSRCRDL